MDKLAKGHIRFSPTERNMIDIAVRQFGSNPVEYVQSPHMWRQLLEAFVDAKNAIDLSSYAERTGSIHAEEFTILPEVGDILEHHPALHAHRSLRGVLTDAPFAYVLEYKPTPDGHPDVISIISFRLDLVNRVVLIDQIQGSDTRGQPRSSAYKARKLFRGANPEYALYDAVRQFALACDFKAVGIKKSIAVNEHVRALVAQGKETIYEKVAEYAGHDETSPLTEGDLRYYTFEHLLTRDDVRYDR